MPYAGPAAQRLAQRRSYEKLKEERAQVQRDKRSLKRRFVEEFKFNKPCHDCGILYPPYVMDFDHVRDTKVGNITDLVQHGTMAALVAEVEKCEIVCANCHRERSFQRKITWKGKS